MKDLSSQKFGRLTVLEKYGKNKYGNYIWLCKCDCGNNCIAVSKNLIRGHTKSCGCYRKEISTNKLQKHGITTNGKPRTFIIWNGMKARCLNKNSVSYKNYGARGIKICDDWMVFENFHNWAISNGYSDFLEIDRIDNDGNYEPDNCRWVTKQYNISHSRRTRYVNILGFDMYISEICRGVNMSRTTAYKLLNKSESEFVREVERRITTGKGQIYFINKFLKGESK